MRLTRIRLTDFKRHEELEIEPAAGLTIVRGPNEAGKSTLQQAIVLGLFRKADANRDDIRKAARWGATDPPSVEIDFESDGQTGTLRKRFAGGRGESELTLGGDSVRDPARIAEVINDLTGIPSESFFRATASVGHAELVEVSGDEPLIRDRLQQAISGADRGTGQARKKLKAAVHRYRTEGQKNPGLLKVVREEIAMLEGELADGERALQRLQVDRAAWVAASEQQEQLERQLNLQQADLAEAQRALALTEQQATAQDAYERLKRAAELQLEADELRTSFPTSVPLDRLRRDTARAANLEMELSELQAVLDAEMAVRAETEPEPLGPPPRPVRWLLLAILLLLAGAAGWFVLGSLAGAVVFVVLLVAAAGALVQSARVATRRRQYGLAQQMAEARTAQLHAEDRARHEEHRARQRDLEGLLASLEVEDVPAAQAILTRAETHNAELSRIGGELDGLGVTEHDVEELQRSRDQAASEAAQAGHALAAMGSLADAPAAAVRNAERQIAQVRPQRDDARSAADQAQGRVDANVVDAELVAGLAERLAASRERETQLERRLAVYQGTLDAIDAAEQATLKTAARFLEERMGPSISVITDDRYDEIEVDEKNLDFQVRAPETGELVDVAQLSQGTADQLFLTARLGLVRLVTMERRPPLILDDPFVTFDRSRGERALRLVKRVAAEQGFQVLYLTCSSRFDALADKLIVLEGPTTDRVLAMPMRKKPPPPVPGAPEPTLVFEPDLRPNPDPVAPRATAPEPATSPSPGFFDDEPVPGVDPQTGVADPFGLGSTRDAEPRH